MARKLELWQRIERLAQQARALSKDAARTMNLRTADQLAQSYVLLNDAANRCGKDES